MVEPKKGALTFSAGILSERSSEDTGRLANGCATITPILLRVNTDWAILGNLR